METLPTDILEDIFFRLDTESNLQNKRVCKTWRIIIGYKVGLLFLSAYLDRWNSVDKHKLYYRDPKYLTDIENFFFGNTLTELKFPTNRISEPDFMVGSCNGLVCCKLPYSWNKDSPSFVCNNPITGEVVYVPGIINRGREPLVSGFGYVESTNEYKVVGIYFQNWAAYVEVYTLGTRFGWRENKNVPTVFSVHGTGIFANGALHWMEGKSFSSRECKIIAFSLADEKFWPMPSPPPVDGIDRNELILLGGNLCVVHTKDESINRRLDIWAFKKTNKGTSTNGKGKEKRQGYYYDDHTWSWSKEYSIAWEGKVVYTPFVITKKNRLLLLQNKTSNLWCYDPKTSTLQKYWDGDKQEVYLKAIPRMNSLVSLEGLREI